MSWVWLAAAIGCEIAATLGLRASDGLHRKRWLLLVAAGVILVELGSAH